ncbi:hypothetical protein D0Z07_0254 [Hyphodiscus hymeniophilus]|uniref:Mediator of RNA polymerase II transcription subunit 1 n=1 Tax=Hyphodiscus hymeniophilus TaxID=353542 RepID=A0A9P7B1A8_9HELO|nr:hypothetical protein D0Z07_0254 [Hyphodiscus hymeniophilus]
MATPTAMASKHPFPAVATPPVSTPFSGSHGHPAFSPHGPRSVVPSPQQVRKSPANSNTLYGYPSGSGGGHPTNSSFGAGYDSPSAAMAMGGVQSLDMGLDGVPGMGGMGGLGALGDWGGAMRMRGRGEGMWFGGKARRDTSKGRLSEAGIERLARRVGLECLWEDHMGSRGSTRTLIIAGSALALDIDFSNKFIVKKVALSFPESAETVTRHTEKAGNILLRDLEFKPNESPLTKMLDRFAANLERLATLDRLSVIPGLNCHEAIAGIYESLGRLHKWEVERLKEQEDMSGKGEEFLERTVMCMKSGKPSMHTRDRLGLSLDYWQEKRYVASKAPKEEQKTWSLLVECAPMPPMVYPPLRVSENWISPEIQKENPPAEDIFLAAEGGLVLDWLEPENTSLPSSEPPKVDGMEGIDQASSQKFSDVIFVAKFDPPLVIPGGIAMQIYNSTGTPMDVTQPSTFDGLMFPYGPEDKIDPSEGRMIKREITVPIFSKDGERSNRVHRNTLFIEKVDYGMTLTELPFSHPRQLVEMLPALRQYAFLYTVLSKSFSSSRQSPPKAETKHENKSKKDDFALFMSQPPNSTDLRIDISFSIQPLPRLQVVFPFKNRTANVTFDIKLNGVVEVVSQNVIKEVVDIEGTGDGGNPGLKLQDLGTMLEITEDLGIWVEFVRRRLG